MVCEYCGAVMGDKENNIYLPEIQMPCCGHVYHGYCLNMLLEELRQDTCQGCKKGLDAKTIEMIRIAAGHVTQCPICLEELVCSSDKTTFVTKCHHWYHAKCVVPAMEMNNACPVCRNPVQDETLQKLHREHRAGALQAFHSTCRKRYKNIVRTAMREAVRRCGDPPPRDYPDPEWSLDKLWEHIHDLLPSASVFRKVARSQYEDAHTCDPACEIPPVCARTRWGGAMHGSPEASARSERMVYRNRLREAAEM